MEDSAWTVVRTGPFAWAADASRQVENFTDFGHFAFVHPGLLGDPDNSVVAPYEVDGNRVIVKGAGGSQVYTLDGDTLDGGAGMKFIKTTQARK